MTIAEKLLAGLIGVLFVVSIAIAFIPNGFLHVI